MLPILHWRMQTEKLRLASNHVAANTHPAWNNVIVSLLHDPAKSSYEQNLTKCQTVLWQAACKMAYDTSLAKATDPDAPTDNEKIAPQAAFDEVAEPAISIGAIEVEWQCMTSAWEFLW